MTNNDKFYENQRRCEELLAGLKATVVQVVSDSAVKDARISGLEEDTESLSKLADITVKKLEHKLDDANRKLTDVSAELESAVETIDAENKRHDSLKEDYDSLVQEYDAQEERYRRAANCLVTLVQESDRFNKYVKEAIVIESFGNKAPTLMAVILRAVSLYVLGAEKEIESLLGFKEDATDKMKKITAEVQTVLSALERR